MPIIIRATEKDIAKVVLLPGNPQRAEYIAKKFLHNSRLYTQYRLMFGYTGKYKGYDISVQTTGMGTPSFSMVAEELNMLKAKTLIRIGTTGAIKPYIKHTDLIIATAGHSTHGIWRQKFNMGTFSAVSDFILTNMIYNKAKEKGFRVFLGPVLTSESFYDETEDILLNFSNYGTLAVEMETYALFGIAAKYKLKAASILTVSDTLFEEKDGKLVHNPVRANDLQIKKGVDLMTELVLDTIIENYEYLIK